MEGLLQAMQDLLRPLRNRVALMISRAVLSALSDAEGLQVVQLQVRSADDVHDRAERFQNYGLTSVPLSGAEALVLALGGITSHLAVVALDDRRHRPRNLKAGEVMLYDHLGKFIKLREDGTLHIKAPKILIEGDESAEMRAVNTKIYASHRHRLDVGGWATDNIAEGGSAFQMVNWSVGAVVSTVNNPINPPEVE